jgi:glycine/D-amino acid oxidase-like deaminating enzyme
VIGGGIFGIHSALELAKSGAEVHLAEASDDLLSGASGNSILRVHSGLHYPRDLETAIQSKNGYKPFLDYYDDFIRRDFDNYYGLARFQSKSTSNQVRNLATRAGIQLKEVDVNELLPTGLDIDLVEAAWNVSEGVVDLPKLKQFYSLELQKHSVNLVLNCTVRRLDLKSEKWLAYTDSDFMGHYDYVVRATHGGGEIESNQEKVNSQVYEFHLTSMLEIETSANPFGMTILDGEFISLLPTGEHARFLVYGPGVSIVEKYVGKTPPVNWKHKDYLNIKKVSEETVGLLGHWFPSFPEFSLVRTRNTVRTIESGVQATDRRVTRVLEVAPRCFEIKSTKIDHVIEVGELLKAQISMC